MMAEQGTAVCLTAQPGMIRNITLRCLEGNIPQQRSDHRNNVQCSCTTLVASAGMGLRWAILIADQLQYSDGSGCEVWPKLLAIGVPDSGTLHLEAIHTPQQVCHCGHAEVEPLL